MARKKRPQPHEEEASEAWLLPYSDLMTLLLALFLCLFAVSNMDKSKAAALGNAFSSAFNLGGPAMFQGMGPNVGRYAQLVSDEDKGNGAYLSENQQLEEVQRKLDRYISQNNLKNDFSTNMTEGGLLIRIKEKAIFQSGSAEPQGEAAMMAPVVANLLESIPEQVLISGHTDNEPIFGTGPFRSNWDLSSARAVNFMKLLLASNPNLDPARFSAVGYSEYRPAYNNDTEEGRSRNRRVEILVSRMYRLSGNTQLAR